MKRKEVNKTFTFTISGKTTAYVTSKKDINEIRRCIQRELNQLIPAYIDITATDCDGASYEGSTGLTTCRVKVEVKD